MTTDARIARFGRSLTSLGLGSVTLLPHPALARLYVVSATPGDSIVAQMPTRGIVPGYQFTIWNKGSGSDGDVSFLDGSLAEMTLEGPAGGASMTFGHAAHCYFLGGTSWAVYVYPVGARTVTS